MVCLSDAARSAVSALQGKSRIAELLVVAKRGVKGIEHRDVKPGNILTDEFHSTLKFVDFGAAKVGDQG